ncbi:MAG: S-layer homology domain-containing protein [Candidatus Gracilibacteria bacterium]
MSTNLKIGLLAFTLFFSLQSVSAQQSSFNDTSNYPWKASINYLSSRGIIQGYADGSFQPINKINRAEFTKIIIGALYPEEIKTFSKDSCFPDVPANEWFTPYICLGKTKGIIKGNPDGKFHPANLINQAESLKILLTGFGLSQESTSGTWYQPFFDTASALKMYYFTKEDAPAYEISRGEMAYFTAWLLSRKEGQKVDQLPGITERFSYSKNGDTYTVKINASQVQMRIMSGNESLRHKELSPPDNCNYPHHCIAEAQAETFSSFINRSHKKLVVNGSFFDAYSKALDGKNFHQISSDIIINGAMKSMYGWDNAFGDGGMLAQLSDGSFKLFYPIREWLSSTISVQNALSNYPLILKNGVVREKNDIPMYDENDVKFWSSGRRGGFALSQDKQTIIYVSTLGTVSDLGRKLKEAGGYLGFALDAGSSNGFYFNGTTFINPGRKLTTVVEIY